MSYQNIGQAFGSIVNQVLTAFTSILQSVANFIEQNADIFGVIAGATVILGLIAGFTGKIPFIGNILSSLGL